ncbi:enolase C-terminal domain-like protein [uncultured Sphaerochaeta sp.]|uniref:enolase C-terminal domain-like protein n=1 Tax=uncultured Sphaerochaeta sp. TaxID=886478 RepID=UPI002A0A889E|nr:enolase C-terminal domain-like protein [uncultured Sphaerochaeta sp.]
MIEIKVFSLHLALKTPFRIAHGTYTYRENVFIQLRKDDWYGYGEAPIVPYYGLTAEMVMADIKNTILQDNSFSLEPGKEGQPLHFAYPVSCCAYQSALINLQRALAGQLGENQSGLEIPQTSFTLAYDDNIENMIQLAKTCGFRRLKIKAGIPGDVERIARIKEAVPDSLLRIDANQGWSFEQAPAKIAELERIGVEFIEEPIEGTPSEVNYLAQNTSVPIVLDESIKDMAHLKSFIAGAPQVSGIVVKIAKSGGPEPTLALIETAKAAGWNIMLSCMVESSIGIISALSLAPLCTWIDLDAPLLLAEEPFGGLDYLDERPCFRPSEFIPSDKVKAYLDTIVPILRREEK